MELPNLIHLKKWVDVLAKVCSNPEDLHSWDNGGFLPIHNVCFQDNVPMNVIEAFVDAYPESVKLKSQSCGLLPIHCAVHHYSSTNPAIVKFLLRHYKEGASEIEVNGRTPLIYHLLVCQSPSLDTTKMLVDAHPDSVRICDKEKWNPLHYAAYRGNWEISQYLIEMYPDALLEENIDNRTPRGITVCNGRYQLADKFLEAEEDIQSGMMKITEHLDQVDTIIDNEPDQEDNVDNKIFDSLPIESISTTISTERAPDEMDNEGDDIIQRTLPVQDKDYSYSRSMHDRLVYDWN